MVISGNLLRLDRQIVSRTAAILAIGPRSCLHVRPKAGEVCFTVSDVGVDLPPIVEGRGVDALVGEGSVCGLCV